MSLSFSRAAREAPDRTVLVAGEIAYTFEEFLPFVNAALHALAARGLRPGDARPVAFLASARKETIAFIYALIDWGIPAVPLRDTLAEREQESILERCGPVVRIEGPLPEARAESPPFGTQEPPPDDGRPLAIVHTSGTSGRPKGVVLSRAAFAASAASSAANLGWEEEDRWALALSLAHVGGFSIVTRCLLGRRAVVLAGSFAADRLRRAIEKERVTLLSVVPAMLRRLLDIAPRGSPPSSLRAVLVGGGPLSSALLDEAWERGIPAYPTYGLTETCSQVAAWPYGTRPAGPVARALPGAELRAEGGRIYVRGPMLFTSYVSAEPEASPFLAGGWFDTGDLGAIDEAGRVHVFGRSDEMLVTGGENVSPREVETEIERFPGVRAACVFGIPDETWGDVLAAAIVVDGEALDRAALAAHLAASLAPHKRPRRIARLDRLPLSSTGKIDRERTRSLALPLLEPFRP